MVEALRLNHAEQPGRPDAGNAFGFTDVRCLTPKVLSMPCRISGLIAAMD